MTKLALTFRRKVTDDNEFLNDLLLRRISQLALVSLNVQIYREKYDDFFSIPVLS